MTKSGRKIDQDFSGAAERELPSWTAIEGDVFEGNTCIFPHGADGKPGKKQFQRARLAAAAPALYAACQLAMVTFRKYEAIHRAKPDHEKANSNAELADQMCLALMKARGQS